MRGPGRAFLGVAFPLEKGGFSILFDAPTNGRLLHLPEREQSVVDEG